MTDGLTFLYRNAMRLETTLTNSSQILNCFPFYFLSLAAEEVEDHIQAAAAWALGQIGRHTPEHAKAVAVANVLPKLLQCYLRAGSYIFCAFGRC